LPGRDGTGVLLTFFMTYSQNAIQPRMPGAAGTMKLNQLRIFEAVTRHLNVTKAANELNMSQPAVSLQVKLLEREYNATFFERNSHGMDLTPQGASFLQAIRPILDQIETVEAEFNIRRKSSKIGVLIIGGNNTLSVTFLPEILIDFKKRHPEVQIVAETNTNDTIEERVVNSEVEIALITHPTYSPCCIYEAYKDLEIVAFVRADSPLGKRTMTLQELTRNALVVRRGSTAIRELATRGYNLNLAMQCDAPEAVKMAVRSGLGIGLIFKPRIQSEIAKGEFRLIDVPELKDIKSESFIIYDRRKSLSPIARDFVQTLRRFKKSADSPGMAARLS
jgi:DNA-binding transcriptional LysR family regulator